MLFEHETLNIKVVRTVIASRKEMTKGEKN
jgi:hypothetical protein